MSFLFGNYNETCYNKSNEVIRMKIRFKERMADVFISLTKPIINIIASREFNIISTGETINKNREPFILVSNHFNAWDSFIVMKNIHYNIRFLANQIVFKEDSPKNKMGFLARFFLKKIGTLKVDELEKAFEYLEQGYAIGMFPEGATTFHGASLKVKKETGDFIKKANVDVIAVKQSGGYLSHPRWANHFAKCGVIHTETSVIIKKEDLAALTPLKINKIILKAIKNNDYDFQKEHMIKLQRENRAEGIERVLYFCNKCNSPMTVFGNKDNIYCSKCGEIGHINTYELIEGNQFDNLVDYYQYQYTQIEKVVLSEFIFFATLNIVNIDSLTCIRVGHYKVKYSNKTLYFTDRLSTYTFEFDKMTFPVMTLNNCFRFDYGDETYNISDFLHPVVLYEMCRYFNKLSLNEVKK